MIIFIEGIDRTGKTSLAKDLELRLDRRLRKPVKNLHFSAPKDRALVEYGAPLLDYDGSYDLVIDRFHIGEAIWPRHFGRPSRMDVAERALIELLLYDLGAVAVLTERSPYEVRQAFKEAEMKGEPEPLSVTKVLHAQYEFECEMTDLLVPRHVYDHGAENREERVHSILRSAVIAQARAERENGITFEQSKVRQAVEVCIAS